MKKSRTFVVTLAMALLMSQFLFAGAANWDPATGSSNDLKTTPGTIPMYGYVGPEVTDVVDPDDGDPDVNPFYLNVSVPVKFLWAAFEPLSGLQAPVESPDYNIINRSKADYNVAVIGFTEKENPLDPALGEVELFFTEKSGTPLFDEQLLTSAAPGAPITLGTIAAQVAGVPTEWTFNITGEYEADTIWPSGLQLPIYDVVLSFEAV